MNFKSATALGVGLLAASIGTSMAANLSGFDSLRVEMAPVMDKSTSDFLGEMRFTLRNPGKSAVRVLKWQTPFDGVEADIFSIYAGGQKIEYVGELIKRGAPTADDYLTLAPGEVRSINVDLSAYYDFAKTGQYEVRYGDNLRDEGGLSRKVASTAMVMWVDGSDQFLGSPASMDPWHGYGIKALNPAPAFTKCTTTQQSQITTALNSARGYATESRAYYNNKTYGQITTRYQTWFGSADATRFNRVVNNYTNIEAALTGQQMTFDCGCKKTYFAYVYPTQPYKIYLCKAFWSAANTGTDSRAGTIIHEVSHFDIVANTDDVVYGQSGAKSLAISNPNDSVRNADSHEYFSENTPAQQ